MKMKNAEIGPDARLLVTGRYYPHLITTMLTALVSGTKELRDGLQTLARQYLDDNLTLLKLEYQPTEY
jgi:hypothetical protein